MNRRASIVNRQWQWLVLGLILLAFSLLLPPYHWSFIGDDFVQFRYVWRYMDRPFTVLALLNPYTLPWYYRPLQNYWFLGNSLLFGFNPFPYYAILGTFHALAICLFYRTSRQLRLSQPAAVAVAALFAIHAHWVDVVGWLSSVAIVLAAVFNLAAVSAYLTYLQKKGEGKWLVLTAVFFILALLTHEESFLLPILLLVIRRLETGNWGLRSSLREGASFLVMLLLTAVYLYTQATRPNLTLEAGEIGLSGYLSHVNVAEIGRFVADTVARFTLWFDLPNSLGAGTTLIAFGLIVLLAVWFWRGGRVVKLGLLWAGLHLIFIYFALWTQKPELYAGRHIYQAYIGLLWAVGAGIDRWRVASRQWRVKLPQQLRFTVPLLLLLTAVFLFHWPLIRNTQASWRQLGEKYSRAEAQVKQILPAANEKTTVFAYRFPITPSFLPATFQVWYETTINTAVGGGLSRLQHARQATRDYYLFDYRDGDVYNLMPELQEHAATQFLWAEDGRIEQITADGETTQLLNVVLEPTVAGPAADPRVVIMPPIAATADTWTSLIYLVTVPAHSQLQASLYAPENEAIFHVRLLSDGVAWETLLETAVAPGTWQDITIPLSEFEEQSVILRLENLGEGWWGNPRFTID